MWLTSDLPKRPQVEVSLWCKEFLKAFSSSYQLKVNNSCTFSLLFIRDHGRCLTMEICVEM